MKYTLRFMTDVQPCIVSNSIFCIFPNNKACDNLKNIKGLLQENNQRTELPTVLIMANEYS
jgi:hypothetical protein